MSGAPRRASGTALLGQTTLFTQKAQELSVDFLRMGSGDAVRTPFYNVQPSSLIDYFGRRSHPEYGC